jgi:hypothetical protein
MENKDKTIPANTNPEEDEEKKYAHIRRHTRYNVGIKVSYMIITDFTSTPYMYGTTKTLNLSEGGMCLQIDYKTKVPIMIQLNLQVPQIKYPLSVLGKVVWCKEDLHGKYIVGIRFVGLLPKDWEKILEIAAKSTPEIQE